MTKGTRAMKIGGHRFVDAVAGHGIAFICGDPPQKNRSSSGL